MFGHQRGAYSLAANTESEGSRLSHLAKTNVRSWQILLQNSFWITQRKFSGPLVRRSNIYVRDHMIERRTHG
jgi:hypothetical protein